MRPISKKKKMYPVSLGSTVLSNGGPCVFFGLIPLRSFVSPIGLFANHGIFDLELVIFEGT